MKIRTQINCLLALIIAIPFLCAIYFPLYNYLSSPSRLLLEGYEKVAKIENPVFSEKDKIQLKAILKELPSDVELAIFTKTFEVVGTNIPEMENMKVIENPDFWRITNDVNSSYYYQLTMMNSDTGSYYIFMRIPRTKHAYYKKNRAGIFLYVLLFYLVALCVFTVILITRNIFKSITLLEQQTQDIADGNLSVKIETHQRNRNEITSISESLEKMRLSLEDAQTRRNKFIMGISHDLRTPVAIIKGYTEAITDGVVKQEEMDNTLGLISTKTAQLETMIDTLINFMKLDSQDWLMNLKSQSVTTLLKEFAHASCITGPIFKRIILSDVVLENDVCVPLDPQLVTRIFENLLSNAIRYTSDNDVIRIWARETENAVLLKIIDTGEGMSEENIAHIFDLFYRATSSRREEGMGIGLSVVKSILTTLKWSIDVKSELGMGSEFTITIPKV